MSIEPTEEDFAALRRAQEMAAAAEAMPREPMLAGPKRQHFVPRFYLEGFARDGLVAVYDRQTNDVRLQQPKNTTVIGHFYTMEDEQGRRRYELEALLSEYEGKAKPAIAKLSAGDDLNADERSDLAIFVAFAAMRTPDMVNSVQAMNAQMVTAIAKRTITDPDAIFARLRSLPEHQATSDDELRERARQMVQVVQDDGVKVTTNEKWAMKLAFKSALDIAPVLAGRDWIVLHRPDVRTSFITTDAPVVLSSLSADKTSLAGGVGFASEHAVITFPLDQSCVLHMLGTDGDMRHREATRDHVRQLNLLHAERCQRFVLGRDEALMRLLADRLQLHKTTWRPKVQVRGR